MLQGWRPTDQSLHGIAEHGRLTNCQGRHHRGNGNHRRHGRREARISVSTGAASNGRHCSKPINTASLTKRANEVGRKDERKVRGVKYYSQSLANVRKPSVFQHNICVVLKSVSVPSEIFGLADGPRDSARGMESRRDRSTRDRSLFVSPTCSFEHPHDKSQVRSTSR